MWPVSTKTLWGDDPETKPILNFAVLTGKFTPAIVPDDESDEDLIEPRAGLKNRPSCL